MYEGTYFYDGFIQIYINLDSKYGNTDGYPFEISCHENRGFFESKLDKLFTVMDNYQTADPKANLCEWQDDKEYLIIVKTIKTKELIAEEFEYERQFDNHQYFPKDYYLCGTNNSDNIGELIGLDESKIEDFNDYLHDFLLYNTSVFYDFKEEDFED